MKEEVKSNQAIMNKATERAKVLIENYINQLGSATGMTYTIEWD